MLFRSHVFIKICAQILHTIQCMHLIAPNVNSHVGVFCCGVPIKIYSVLELFNFSFMPCIQVLMSLMHRSMDSRLLSIESWWNPRKLMVIDIGMSQMQIRDRETVLTRVLCEFHRTYAWVLIKFKLLRHNAIDTNSLRSWFVIRVNPSLELWLILLDKHNF